MFPSFTLRHKFDGTYPSNLQIFQPDYKTAEKEDLTKRIQAIAHQLPQQFSAIITGVCHADFKITVNDVLLLQDLKSAALFFVSHPNFRPYAQSNTVFWQEIACKLDQLIQERAALPLLNLPYDLLYQIMSYLPLSDLSNMIQASCIRVSSESSSSKSNGSTSHLKTKKQTQIISLKEEMIASYPRLILEAPHSSAVFKARVCHILSKQWQIKKNADSLSNLFLALHRPCHSRVRYHYLNQMTDAKLFQAFLDKQYTKDKVLSLNTMLFSSSHECQSFSAYRPLLQPNSHSLAYWNQLIEAYSHVEGLNVTTKLNDHLTAFQRNKSFWEVFNRLQQVRHLELNIQNLAQSVPVYFPSQLKLYQDFIYNFKELKTLTLKDRQPKESGLTPRVMARQVPSVFPDIEQRIFTSASNLQKLLHPNLQVQSIQIDLDCFPSFPLDRVEEQCVLQMRAFYPMPYLKLLLPLISHALQLKELLEIQVILPLPLKPPSFEKITRALPPQYRELPGQMEMNVLEDKLLFIFKKTLPSPAAH